MALPPPSDSATALVTGASSGIGVEFARELARRGHGVTLLARRDERLQALAEELRTLHGVGVEVIVADLAENEARDAVATKLAERGLDVEVLVNNAGFGDGGDFVDAARERLREMVRVNVEAVMDMTARFLGSMTGRGRGAVINVASTAAFQPMPGTATYGATKAFVLSFSEALHAEVADRGVTVTALCPGPVKTEFAQIAGVKSSESRLPSPLWTPPDQVAREAVEGAAHGKRVVVPGVLNRAGALGGQHAPRAALLPVVRRAWRHGAQ